jgi:hypothetical protein
LRTDCRDESASKAGYSSHGSQRERDRKGIFGRRAWLVLPGVETEPGIIWLRQADGNRHTWDASDILDTFEVVSK